MPVGFSGCGVVHGYAIVVGNCEERALVDPPDPVCAPPFRKATSGVEWSGVFVIFLPSIFE